MSSPSGETPRPQLGAGRAHPHAAPERTFPSSAPREPGAGQVPWAVPAGPGAGTAPPARTALPHRVLARRIPPSRPPSELLPTALPLLARPGPPGAGPGTPGPSGWRDSGPGGGGAGGLAPQATWSGRDAAESRVNQPLQGLGVSCGREAGQGCGLAGAAHSAGRGRALGPAEARESARPFKARPETRGSPRRELPAPLALPPAVQGSLPPGRSGLLPTSPPEIRDMGTPTWPRVLYPEAAVSRTILFGWVLVQLAGASGEWHLPPEPTGHAALGRGPVLAAEVSPGCT